MTIYVGTSGWQYRDWRERFYPRGVPQRQWLAHFAARFQTVEVNNTFYRLPERPAFAGWAAQTPDDFVITLKVSRYLTHIRRLSDPDEAVERFFDRAAPLGAKMGPLLVQLPANFHRDLVRLERALCAIGGRARVAVEFRHASWFADEVFELLERHGAALVLADRGSRPVTPLRRTADWGYVRLHAGTATPLPCYGRAALDSWALRIATLWDAGEDVFVYFNNDPHACAVSDARRFAGACRRRGLACTRVPDARSVHAVA